MKELAKKLFDHGCLEVGDFTLKNGSRSGIYFNVKKAYGDPDMLRYIIDEISKGLKPEKVNCVVGMGHGSYPLIAGMSMKYGLKMTSVREKSKNHGIGGKFEYHRPEKGDSYLIVDDVGSAYGTVRKIAGAIKSTEARVSMCYVVLDRSAGNKDWTRSKESLGFPVRSLINTFDFF